MRSSVAIKFCGICTKQAALQAVSAGADYLGLIFSRSSRRYVEPQAAVEIAEAVNGQCKLVGLFQDVDAGFINQTARLLQLDTVQLHGTEEPEICDRIELPVIKAITVPACTESDTSCDLAYFKRHISNEIERFTDHCAFFLFDRPKNTDTASQDYLKMLVQTLSTLNPGCDYFVAGGLDLTNVAYILKELHPYGVDVASGVESEPRVKDLDKMQKFCDAVRGNGL